MATTMLYNAEDALHVNDAQSTREAEDVLSGELAALATSAPSAQAARKQRLLHFIDAKRFRLPHVAVRLGTDLLHNAGKLGSAVWDVYERVVFGAADAHDLSALAAARSALEAQWPSSVRVARLRGVEAEARGHVAEAADIYASLLKDDPSNAAAARRQIALEKSVGNTNGAIELLNAFLRTHASDEPAWLELSELYCSKQQYQLAAYAMEELLLLVPENYLYHTRYAELQATLGDWNVARQYYAQALELKPVNNLRALWGLQLALERSSGVVRDPPAASSSSSAVQQVSAASTGAARSTPDSRRELATWTQKQLQAHYNKFAPSLAAVAAATIAGESSAAAAAPAPSTGASTTANTASAAVTATSQSSAASVVADVHAAAAAVRSTLNKPAAEEPVEPQASDLPD